MPRKTKKKTLLTDEQLNELLAVLYSPSNPAPEVVAETKANLMARIDMTDTPIAAGGENFYSGSGPTMYGHGYMFSTYPSQAAVSGFMPSKTRTFERDDGSVENFKDLHSNRKPKY